MTNNNIVTPGSRIGIIGGGQLGRMTALAAANLGYRVNIYTPVSQDREPAAQVSDVVKTANYDDVDSLKKFAQNVDVLTLEFENIPYASIQEIAKDYPVFPSWNSLYYAQHRMREKNFIRDLGIGTAEYAEVINLSDLIAAVAKIGTPAILKTAEMGYDGKGQHVIRDGDDLNKLWSDIHLDGTQWVLEGFVDFAKEISVVIARGKNGEVKAYQPTENHHEEGMLIKSFVPAIITPEIYDKAIEYTTKIANKLEYVGVMAVEYFVCKDGRVLVNEFAPRPHNSGHWTMDGCITSQFEQHVRAICGLPLGSVDLLCDKIEMVNLIGEDVHNWPKYSSEDNAKIHIYGKKQARAGRKMGHVNYLYY
jgi:5-(carboxyamino)imidazole ribonucleotide synthase